MLDTQLKAQLNEYLQLMEDYILLKVSTGSDETSEQMNALVDELKSMSPKIRVEHTELERTPSFSVNRIDEDTGIVFAGLPLGHEFTSLVLALLQVSGRAPKIDDEVKEQIEAIDDELHFESTLVYLVKIAQKLFRR